MPAHHVGAPSRSKAMRMKPYTATFVITPLISPHGQVQAGEEGRIERQRALRFMFVPTVSERVETGAGRTQPDDDQKEGGQRVEAKMRADPGQAERQHDL